MKSNIRIAPELVIAELCADNQFDAIAQLGSRLVSGGHVRDSYIEAVLKREKNYPTGIEFPACGVALPHGESDGVITPAIAVGRCDRPVAFKRMDDFSETIDVSLIVLLAVLDPDGHLDVLGKLINTFSNSIEMNRLMQSDSTDEIAHIIDAAIH